MRVSAIARAASRFMFLIPIEGCCLSRQLGLGHPQAVGVIDATSRLGVRACLDAGQGRTARGEQLELPAPV